MDDGSNTTHPVSPHKSENLNRELILIALVNWYCVDDPCQSMRPLKINNQDSLNSQGEFDAV